MATEKLKFKLELYATMWDKAPHAEIFVDGKSYYNGEITSTQDNPTLIEFEAELEENKDCDLIINRSNKTVPQTVVNEKGDILKDQMLHIKKIEIDEIFEKLDKNSRDILFKRFYEAKTAKEIGQDNGYGRETARRRINEALEKLKQCLQN